MILVCYAIINIGRDTIKTKVDLNLISNNITKLLKDNKIYLPLSKDVANIFTSYEENQQNFDELISQLNKELIQNTLLIHKNYSSSIEDINRALKVAITKNESEIENFQVSSERNIKVLQTEVTTSKKVYKESMEVADLKYTRTVFDADTIYNEEIASIDVELKDLRQRYRVELQKNDNEKAVKLAHVSEQYEKVAVELKDKISLRRTETDTEINVLTNNINEQKINTDETYLTIKTTHTQANVKFNEFVNTRKIEKDKNIEQLTLSYEASLIPYEKKLEKIKALYDSKIDDIQTEYSVKLKALNVIFDVQKNAYNDKTSEIIGKNNTEVTKINANFSAARDQIDNKKLDANDLHRERLLETVDEHERNLLYRQYQKDIKKLNEQLTNEIETNEKLISEQEIKLQMHLYNHDAKHIEQINKWRQSKNIYEFERNQKFLKAKHEYQNDELAIKLELLLIKDELEAHKKIEEIKLNKDLQPIETQLVIASLVQEREINLLNTENETYQNTYKLQQSVITNRFFKDELIIRQEIELAKEKYRYNKAVINIKHQLEFEKMRQGRDHEIFVLDLNKKLQKSLLDQKYNIAKILLDSKAYQANLNINNLDARLNYETKLFRQQSLLEFEKRNTIISEIKLKNQRLSISEKTKRTLLLAKADANLHQAVSELLFKEIYSNYELESNAITFVNNIFKLPAHPETFRQVLKNVVEVLEYIKEYLTLTNNDFINIDSELYQKRIDNITEYKYRIKHEELINLYSNNIEQVKNKRTELLKDNEYITSQIRVLDNKKILNDSLIGNYKIDITKANKEKDFYAVTHAKSQIRILLNENKLLKAKLKASERDIIRLSAKVIPLSKEIKALERKQKNAKVILDREKFKEELKYQKLLKNHIQQYYNFNKYINKRFNALNEIFFDLINKAYISADYFENSITRLLKNQKRYQININSKQQMFINNWLKLYNITKNDQNKIMTKFDNITEFSINKIRKMHIKFSDSERKEKVYLSQIYLNETKRNNDYIKKSEDNALSKIKAMQNQYKNNYATAELTIVNNNAKAKRGSSIISENLKGVLEQLKNENINNLLRIRKDIKKENITIETKLTSQIKNISEIERRNTIRTSAIISRYERRKERRFKQMQSFIKKYTNDIENIMKAQKANATRFKHNIKQNIRELNNYNLNLEIATKRYRFSSVRDQNKITRKEKRTLKNSYKFKRKQIKATNK